VQAQNPVQQKRRAIIYAAIYIRVSSERQEENYSLETQREGCLQYARERGYVVEEQHIYQEVKTGAIYRERLVLAALRAAARRREFTVAIVYDLDRLSREAEHQTIIMEDLAYSGVKVECVLREIDDTPEGRLMLNILGYTATVERERTRERTMRGRRARAERDKRLLGQGREKYGLKFIENRSKYVPNDETVKVDESGFTWTKAMVVKHMFSIAYEGVSLRQIAMYLTRKGIPTPTEGKRKNSKAGLWSPSTVAYILTDPIYKGKAEANRYVWLPIPGSTTHRKRAYKRPAEERIPLPEGTVVPLIEEDVFDAVQERLARNQRFAPRNADKELLAETYLRCGFITCGYCGATMSARREKASRGRQESARYRCNTAQRGYGECRGTSIVTHRINSAVWERIREVVREPSLVEETLQAREQQPEETLDELTPIEKSIASVERRIRNYNRVVDTGEDEDVIDDAVATLAQLANEKRRLEKEKREVLAKQSSEEKEQEQLEKFKQWCADMREKIDDSAYAPSYEELMNACRKLGIKAVIWKPDHKPHFTVQCSPADIVSGRSASSLLSSDRCL
jgi:site-specific DNA recombinase